MDCLKAELHAKIPKNKSFHLLKIHSDTLQFFNYPKNKDSFTFANTVMFDLIEKNISKEQVTEYVHSYMRALTWQNPDPCNVLLIGVEHGIEPSILKGITLFVKDKRHTGKGPSKKCLYLENVLRKTSSTVERLLIDYLQKREKGAFHSYVQNRGEQLLIDDLQRKGRKLHKDDLPIVADIKNWSNVTEQKVAMRDFQSITKGLKEEGKPWAKSGEKAIKLLRKFSVYFNYRDIDIELYN